MASQHYKNLIFTKHALARMNERSISEDSIYWVIRDPDTTKGNKDGYGSVKFIRVLNNRNFHVVAQWKKEQSAWLVVSVWVRGEDDREPISTQIILGPFRVIWWLFKQLFKVIFKR